MAAVITLLLALGTAPRACAQEVRTLASGGPSEDRVDLVVLAEGYTASEADRFAADALAVKKAIGSHPVYGRYRRFFNVHSVFAPTRASGIVGRAGGPDRTLFGTRQKSGTMVSADWARVQRAALRAPDVDKMIVLCNTDQDIGMRSGNVVFVSRVNTEDTILHELGHTLANLADEYVRSSGRSAREAAIRLSENPRPNVAPASQLEALPWQRWIEAGTAVPARSGTRGVSAWEGGYTAKLGVYRPRKAMCRMRYYRNDSFCEPCREAIVLALHAMTSPSVVEEERGSGFHRYQISTAIPEGTRQIKWSVQGGGPALAQLIREVNRGTKSSLLIRDELVESRVRLSVVITDATPWVRAKSLESAFSFQLGGPGHEGPGLEGGRAPRPGVVGALEGSW